MTTPAHNQLIIDISSNNYFGPDLRTSGLISPSPYLALISRLLSGQFNFDDAAGFLKLASSPHDLIVSLVSSLSNNFIITNLEI